MYSPGKLRSILLLWRHFCHTPLPELSNAGSTKRPVPRGRHAGFPSLADVVGRALRAVSSNELFLQGLWPLGFLSLFPFYLALRRSESPRRAAVAGAVFGGAHHALTSYWLFFYKGFAFWTLGTTTIAYIVVYAAVGLYGSFMLHSEAKTYRPFVFALGWTLFEFLNPPASSATLGPRPYSLIQPVFLQMPT